MGLKRWFYRGGRPNRVARALDRCTSALYGRGIAPDYLVTLEVVGRRSGRIVALPLVMAVVGGERYLVSMLGEKANWVRNVRAAEGEVTIRHGRREEVRLEEVAVGRRAPVLKAYLQRAPNARAHLPVAKDAPLAEFERVEHRFPVFQVTPSDAASPASSEVDDEVREPPHYKRLKPKLLGALGGEVVEIGPGSGVNFKYYRDGDHWTGIEPNTFLHERIQQRASGVGIPTQLLAGRAERLDLPDGSVDEVVGSLVLCSVGDQARALSEILRVLKPGGRYVYIEHVAAPLGTRTRRAQETFTPILRRLPGGCSPNRETRRMIERAGFADLADESFELPTSFGIALPHIAGTAIK